ncbi:MAG TPA: PaaI family thioesterase [Candidatus Dormibacteraeota bacterium]|nr:PaaI family thioesterase [Candidatus Dormibacteraeota bacterium]
MREYERFGMWANLGARLTILEPGNVVVDAELTPEAHGFPTPRGAIVHGGALAALADMALASAGGSLLRDGETLATVDLRIEFMQPGRPGPMRARGQVRRRTRRLCFVSASIEQDDGTVVAEARALLAYSDVPATPR